MCIEAYMCTQVNSRIHTHTQSIGNGKKEKIESERAREKRKTRKIARQMVLPIRHQYFVFIIAVECVLYAAHSYKHNLHHNFAGRISHFLSHRQYFLTLFRSFRFPHARLSFIFAAPIDWLHSADLPVEYANFSLFNAYTNRNAIDSPPTKKKIKTKINELCKYRTTRTVIHFRLT